MELYRDTQLLARLERHLQELQEAQYAKEAELISDAIDRIRQLLEERCSS